MKHKISIKEKNKKKLSRIKKPKPVIKIITEKEKRKQVLDLYLKGLLIRSRNKKIRHEKVSKRNIS